MESSFTLVRLRGIPIGAHWSWLLVFALSVWSLSSALFPATYPGLEDSTYLWMGLVTAVLFFLSILLHELGHAFTAIGEGMRIDGITLWLFGGVARFRGTFPSAGAEFRIAIAGPVVSVVLAGLFAAAAVAARALALGDGVLGVADYLARINAVVVAFNLVPALPLDGGRVLRAWLWWRQGSFLAATRSAGRAGKLFGGALAAVGLLNLFTGGGEVGGLWLLFLGWFLVQAAQSETSAALIRQTLEDYRVRDLMTADPVVVTADDSVAAFLDDARPRGHSTYPVVEDGHALGLVSIHRAGTVPAQERERRTLREIMWPRAEVPSLAPETEAIAALEALQQSPRRALVMDGDELSGIISVSDLSRALDVERARGERAERPARGSGVLVWAVVFVAMALAAGALYRPPLVVLEPGIAADVSGDITITGVRTDSINGRYLLTSVRLQRRNGLGVLLAALSPDRDVVPLSAVLPPGGDSREYFHQQRGVFRQSRVIAAAAAAQVAGMEVVVRGAGARVDDVLAGSPAENVLQPGDVILAVDRRDIELVTDLQEAIRSRPAGTRLLITFERNGSERTASVRSASLSGPAEGAVGIGVIVSTRGFDVDLPFDVSFRERRIGGPSAGLAYGLAILDMLLPEDAAAGRTVAATGTIRLDGDVGLVGGVDAKAAAAAGARADIFLVPEQEVDEVTEDDLPVLGVSDLEEAQRLLEGSADGSG